MVRSVKYNGAPCGFVPPVVLNYAAVLAQKTLTPRQAPVCQWCGRELPEQQGRGRRRRYCSASCKQRAYEQRHHLESTGIPADSVVLRPERVDELRDEVYELKCAAEDVRTAAAEGADADEIRHLCDELVAIANRIEKLR